MRSRNHGRERGMTIVMLAVFLVVLFAMAALAIDLGFAYTARTSAQHAADAGALAGAYTFKNPNATQPGAAIDAALGASRANYVLGQQAVITAADVNVDEANRRLTVTVPRTGGLGVATVFARVLGIRSLDVVAQATAEALDTTGASRCLKPIYLPNTFVSESLPLTDLACQQDEVLFDKNCTAPPCDAMPYGLARIGSPDPYNVRPTNPGNALTPSHYYTLDFGAGGNTVRCTLGECLNQCDIDLTDQCGARYPVETGNLVGPVQQGTNDLIGPDPDQWVGLGDYLDPDTGLHFSNSKNVVLAPIWNNCAAPNGAGETIVPGTAGQTAMIIGFAEVFIDNYSGGQGVTAHLVNVIECNDPGLGGGAGGGAGGAGIGGEPIRLIQTP